jgi:hypothetical protein
MDIIISEVFSKYIREMDGSRCFLGDGSMKEHLNATMVLARACRHYHDDVDEELFMEETHTCYNCRFRRWVRSGFSCFKDFPVS